MHQPHTHSPGLLTQRQELETRLVLLLCCSCIPIFVTAHTPRTHTWYIQKRTNIQIHAEASSVAVTKQRACGCYCTATATSIEPGGSCVTQQHSSRADKIVNIWASMGPARLGETRQAAVWTLLCGSCSVLPFRCGARSTTTTREIVAKCQSPM